MTNILQKIAAHKRQEVAKLKSSLPYDKLLTQIDQNDLLDFKSALSNENRINIIAEIKKASPSKGVMTDNFDPARLAADFKEGGAAALSVLTDEKYFQGSSRYMEVAKKSANIPVLCKEFMIDSYQIFYARLMKADAVLLIVRLLDDMTLKSFLKDATTAGLDAIVEVHDENETKRAVDCGARIIGVNNRNLDDFTVSLETSEKLASLIPNNTIKVAESGIFKSSHIKRLKESGYNNFLIGEALVTSNNPVNLLKELAAN